MKPENDTEYLGLPEGLRSGFRRYIEQHIPMGHFGMAVLRNDLTEACTRADETNRPLITDIVRWLYNEAPGDCWGSIENVQQWLSKRPRVVDDMPEDREAYYNFRAEERWA